MLTHPPEVTDPSGKGAPPSRQVKLRVIKTGEIIERWPVDAREMLAHAGVYEEVTDTAPPPRTKNERTS